MKQNKYERRKKERDKHNDERDKQTSTRKVPYKRKRAGSRRYNYDDEDNNGSLG